MSGIACTLLAAGGSRRLGRPKQLLCDRGEPLVRVVMQQLLGAQCKAFAVVVGARGDDVALALEGLRVTRIDNAAWEEGIASSLRAAVDWAERVRAEALLVAVCDQPKLNTAHVDALIAARRSAGGCVASGYAGTRGVPAILDADCFAELRAMKGDRGAGGLLRGRADVAVVDWPEGAEDVDTLEDARRLGLE